MIKVLDARNEKELSKVIDLIDYEIIESFEHEKINEVEEIYCLLIDGFYVPCASSSLYERAHEYNYILCANHKSKAGFDRWFKRFYGNLATRKTKKEILK